MPSPTRTSVLRAVLPLGLPLLIALWGGPAAAAPGCTLTSFDPVIDFGAIRPSAGSGATEIKPSPQRRTFSAVCPDATQMSLVFQGEPRGAAGMRFGERGAYGIRVASARLDGAVVQMAHLPAPGQPPAEEPSGELTL
jgi:hypothetical protein